MQSRRRREIACTEIGCGSSGAQFRLGTFSLADMTPTATSAQGEVCLNNVCSTIVLGELPSSETIEIRGAVVVPNVSMTALLAKAPPDAINVWVGVWDQMPARSTMATPMASRSGAPTTVSWPTVLGRRLRRDHAKGRSVIRCART